MKRGLAILLCLWVGVALFVGCSIEVLPDETGGAKIALIQTSPADPHWAKLETGAMKAASELGAEIVSLVPDGQEDEQAIDPIHEAVSSGCQAVVIAADSSEDVSAALQTAADAGVKIVYVDSAADVEADAAFTTDQKAAGRAAAETMLQSLEARRIREGMIGIIGANAGDSSAAQREEGFRKAFENTAYTLLEIQYGEGDAEKSRSIAEACLSQGAVALFGCDVHSLVGAGRAGRDASIRPVVTGFGESEEVQDLMKDGSIRAAVVPNWDIMGYEAVKAAAAALEGAVQEGMTDTGVTVLVSEAPVTVNSDYKIALITEDRIDRRWITLEEGAMQAAAELGCEVVNLSPHLKDNVQLTGQISGAAASGYHAIVVAVNGSDAVAAALQEAAAADVKVICVDVPAAGVEPAATVLTDSRAAGRAAGETLIAALEERNITEGSIGIIGAGPGAEMPAQREAGFRELFEGKPYTLLETRYSEGDAAKSHAAAEAYLDEGVVGIFCVSEGCTVGAGNAAKEADADALIVGFDTSDVILGMIEKGFLFATMAQNTNAMGYEAVKAACAALKGESPDGTAIDIAVSVLTQ